AKNTLDAFFVPSSSLSLDIAYTTASNVDFIEISGGYRFETMTRTILPESLRDINLNVNSRRPIYIYDENEE
ncbi:MAG: hypothetical protein KDJ26_02980, partial [Alphaproteobacteria bacterium]|nr:hypothetical protein [Alphaproteobacteria bacterium]